MTKNEIEKYHKFHRMTTSYSETEKYIKAGWRLLSVNKVTLKGINKEYDECVLLWDKDDNPIDPMN